MDTLLVMMQSAWSTGLQQESSPEDQVFAIPSPLIELDDTSQSTITTEKHTSPKSTLSVSLNRNRVKMLRTAIFVYALVTHVSSLQIGFVSCTGAPHGQKRKYNGPQSTNIQAKKASFGPPSARQSEMPSDDKSATRCKTADRESQKKLVARKSLGDVLWKFHQEKYPSCLDIGAEDTKTLFRKDVSTRFIPSGLLVLALYRLEAKANPRQGSQTPEIHPCGPTEIFD